MQYRESWEENEQNFFIQNPHNQWLYINENLPPESQEDYENEWQYTYDNQPPQFSYPPGWDHPEISFQNVSSFQHLDGGNYPNSYPPYPSPEPYFYNEPNRPQYYTPEPWNPSYANYHSDWEVNEYTSPEEANWCSNIGEEEEVKINQANEEEKESWEERMAQLEDQMATLTAKFGAFMQECQESNTTLGVSTQDLSEQVEDLGLDFQKQNPEHDHPTCSMEVNEDRLMEPKLIDEHSQEVVVHDNEKEEREPPKLKMEKRPPELPNPTLPSYLLEKENNHHAYQFNFPMVTYCPNFFTITTNSLFLSLFGSGKAPFSPPHSQDQYEQNWYTLWLDLIFTWEWRWHRLTLSRIRLVIRKIIWEPD